MTSIIRCPACRVSWEEGKSERHAMSCTAREIQKPQSMRETIARAMVAHDLHSVYIKTAHKNFAHETDYFDHVWSQDLYGARSFAFKMTDVALDILTKPPTEAMVLHGIETLRDTPRVPMFDPTGWYRNKVNKIWETMVRAMIEGKS